MKPMNQPPRGKGRGKKRERQREKERVRKYGERSNGREMNGKAEKQQGREAAGGFRATIEGFPLRENEPRAYSEIEREGERGSKKTGARAREREKRWSKRLRRGYATTEGETEIDRTRGVEREGERKERDHRLVDPTAIIL